MRSSLMYELPLYTLNNIHKVMYQILIIEDEQRVAELLKRGLEESGYQVVVAFDGNSPVSNLIQEAKNGKGKAKSDHFGYNLT